MARSATGAAQENPLQICAVAYGDSAREASVGSDVVFMELYVGIPFNWMLGKYSAHMALRTRRSTALNTIKILSVTGGIGTGRCAVLLDISRMQGVGEISPPDGMNRVGVADMALGAGDVRSRAS
jgi:hypothetical protein